MIWNLILESGKYADQAKQTLCRCLDEIRTAYGSTYSQENSPAKPTLIH